MKISIHLLDRSLAVKESGAKAIDLGSGPERPYASVQEAIRVAVDATLRHLNVLGPSGAPDFDRLPSMIASGQLELELHGHERETFVAALHLWAAYGVGTLSTPWTDGGMRGASRVVADHGPCFYDTYRFESDIAPIEWLATKASDWHGLVSDSAASSRAGEVYAAVLRILGVKDPGKAGSRPERIRLGILGVTGAGKSSFINALLQRYVVPRSEEICSSCIVEFFHAEGPHQEGFEIVPMPRADRQSMLKAARAALEKAERGRTPDECVVEQAQLRLRALETASQRLDSCREKRLHLSELRPFVSVVEGDLVHVMVAKARVYVAHPLLRHVVIVDTPGLRDPDDRRRRLALAELATLDGWLYLSEGNTKFNISVAKDLREIQEQANNRTGAIVLTKVDHIGASGTLEEAAVTALGKFNVAPVSWQDRSFWCAARAPSLAAERLLEHDSEEPWTHLYAEFDDHGVLAHLNRLGDPCTKKPTHRFRPQRAVMDLIDGADSDPVLQRGLLDYILDASHVPATARGLADVVNEQAIIGRVLRGRKMLLEDVRSRIDGANQSLNENRRHLDNIGSVDRMQSQLVAIEKRITSLAQQESTMLASLRELQAQATERAKVRVGGVESHAKALRERMLDDLVKKVKKAASGQLMGNLSYSFFDSFDGPLASWCSKKIREFRKELCSAAGKHGFDSTAIDEATQADEEKFCLHREPSEHDRIADHEDFWEWFETTLDRMSQRAARKSEKVENEIRNNFGGKLESMAKHVCEVAGAPLAELRREQKDGEKAAKALEADIANLKRGVPGSRDLVLGRISKLETSIQKMEQFEAALTEHARRGRAKATA